MANKDFSKKGLAVALGAIIGAGVLNSVSVTAMEEDIVKSKSSTLSKLVNDGLSVLNSKKDINRNDLTKFQETLNRMIKDKKNANEIQNPVVKENIEKLLKIMMTIALKDFKAVIKFIYNLLDATSILFQYDVHGRILGVESTMLFQDNPLGDRVNFINATEDLVNTLKTKYGIEDTDLN